jgi:hypothetical protein
MYTLDNLLNAKDWKETILTLDCPIDGHKQLTRVVQAQWKNSPLYEFHECRACGHVSRSVVVGVSHLFAGRD